MDPSVSSPLPSAAPPAPAPIPPAPPLRMPPPPVAAALLLLFGLAPLLVACGLDLWTKPLYRFFPLALAGMVLLCWRGWRKLPENPRPGAEWITGALLLSALGALAAGTLLWSPPLGALAGVLALATLAHWFGGWPLLKAWLPAGVIGLALIPPPFALDERILARMRGALVDMGTHMLGQLGVMHVVHADTIELVRGSVALDDAGRGLHLMLAALVVAIILMAWRQRSWLQTALVAVTMPAWVWLGALLWFVFGLKAFAGGSGSVFVGARGFLIAAVLLVLIAGLALSVEQLVLFLTISRRRGVMLDETAALSRTPAAGSRLPPTGLTWMAIGCFLLLGVAQVVVGFREFLPPPRSADADVPTLAGQQPYNLPEQLGMLTLMTNKVSAMDDLVAPGAEGNVWHYARGEIVFSVTLEPRFAGFANLLDDYQAAGWKVLLATRQAEGTNAASPFVEAHLQKDIYQHGRLWFALADAQGRWLPPPALAASWRDKPARGTTIRTFRVQLFVSSLEPLNATDAELAAQLFQVARQQLAAQCVARLSPSDARPFQR